MEQTESYTAVDPLDVDVEMTETFGGSGPGPKVGPQGGGFIANPPDVFGEDNMVATTLPETWQRTEYESFVPSKPVGGNIPELGMTELGGTSPDPRPAVRIRTEAESLIGSDGNPFHGALQEGTVVSVPYAQNLVDVEEYERIHNPQYQRDLADEIELMDLRKGTDAAKTFYMEEEAGAAGIGLVDDPELLEKAGYEDPDPDIDPTEAEIEELYGDGPPDVPPVVVEEEADVLFGVGTEMEGADLHGLGGFTSVEQAQALLDKIDADKEAVASMEIDRRVTEPADPVLGGQRPLDINDKITELDAAFLREATPEPMSAEPLADEFVGPMDMRPWYERWFRNAPKEVPEAGTEMQPLMAEEDRGLGLPLSERPSASEWGPTPIGREQIEAFNDVVESFAEQGVTEPASIRTSASASLRMEAGGSRGLP